MGTNTKDKIDAFHRKLIRQIINIRWPKTISKTDLYRISKRGTSWSSKLKQRRLNWLGHLIRLPEETLARKALEEAKKLGEKKRVRPFLTWWKTILKETKLDFEQIELRQDKKRWRKWVKKVMPINIG